jgi:hypothetical protein
MFRIYPTDGSITDQDHEDLSYSFNWAPDGQYWYDVVYDPSRDRGDQSRQIRMVDGYGFVDSFVIPRDAKDQQVKDLWRNLLRVPREIAIQIYTGNGEEYHRGLQALIDALPFTIRAPSFHMDVTALPGDPSFVADQISRVTGYKLPAFAIANQTPRKRGGGAIEFGGDLIPLGLKIMKMHLLLWNVEGAFLKAPQATTWWVPYHLELIMKYGHVVNSSIPADPNEAEFPPTPWPDEVMIVVKSKNPVQSSPAIASVGGPSLVPPAPAPPSSWQGPALGQASPISADASGLVGYQSSNNIRTVEGQEEIPIDPELLRIRGEARGDLEVHQMISWTTRKDYALWIGISLPIPNLSEERFHEAQLWEETDEDWALSENHAEHAYTWLQNRLVSRSTVDSVYLSPQPPTVPSFERSNVNRSCPIPAPPHGETQQITHGLSVITSYHPSHAIPHTDSSSGGGTFSCAHSAWID